MGEKGCAHTAVRLKAHGQPFTDSNLILMRVAFFCESCGKSFRAVGIADGVSFDAPSSVDDGETTLFPLVPAGEEPVTERIGTC